MNSVKSIGCLAVFCGLIFSSVASAQLVINELMADNTSTDYDDFFESEDWVEIYNSGGIVNLSGYYLSDDADSLNKWMFPSTNAALTTVLPGGHIRVWCDKDPEQGEDHADFKLSQDGETVFLVEPDGITIVDQIEYAAQVSNISFGRSCDGCSDWVYFNSPTPDAPNSDVQPATEQLYFNEFQHLNSTTISPQSGPGGAWLEVYNPNPIDVNTANYTISNETEGSWTIPTNDPVRTVIPSEGFMLIWLSGDESWGGNHSSIYVGNGTPASNWVLTGPDGTTVDDVTWNPAQADESYGRTTDGGPAWQFFAQPTPQVSNQTLLFPGANLVINEILSENSWSIVDEAGEHDDWFEIHNPTGSPVDLAGYYLTDQWNNPTKFRIPVGIPDSTIIEAGGFKLFWADEDQNQGWNHVNFRLNSLGEHLALRSPDGFSVVDSLNFPSIWANFSYGRENDASVPWVFFEQTTPEASNNGATVDLPTWSDESFASLFPNPVIRNQVFSANEPGALWSNSGVLVRSWGNQGGIHAPSEPGIYFIRWMGSKQGKVTKLLVL